MSDEHKRRSAARKVARRKKRLAARQRQRQPKSTPSFASDPGPTSIERALVVATVDEEYQFLVEHLGARVTWSRLRQSIVEKGDRMYDELLILQPDGKRQRFYFDITEMTNKRIAGFAARIKSGDLHVE